MKVFYLVLIFTSAYGSGTTTIPLPYTTESACRASGVSWVETNVSRGNYVCVPAFIDMTAGRFLIDDPSENRWAFCIPPTRPVGIYAGIGTRDLTESGKNSILSLYSEE